MATAPIPTGHQSAVIEALTAVFNVAPSAFGAFTNGGSRALEKLIRGYHYWYVPPIDKPFSPYTLANRRSKGLFRRTLCADQQPPTTPLHPEHTVPVAELVAILTHLRGPHGLTPVAQSDVRDVMALNEVVLVDPLSEVKLLDASHLRSRMPQPWNWRTDSHLHRLEMALGQAAVVQIVGTRWI